MFITIAYNEYGPRNIAAAKETLASICAAFPGKKVLASFEPVPLAVDILSTLKGGDSYHRRKPTVSVDSCFTGNCFGKPKSYVTSTSV